MKKFISVAFFGAVLALSSCHHDKEWGINGKISGISPEQTVLIEGINQGSWYLIDTLKVDKPANSPIVMPLRVILTYIV